MVKERGGRIERRQRENDGRARGGALRCFEKIGNNGNFGHNNKKRLGARDLFLFF